MHYIARSLYPHTDVAQLGPLSEGGPRWKAKQLAYLAMGRRHLRHWEPGLQERYASQVASVSQLVSPDAIFSSSTIPVARLESSLPVILWLDAVFPAMVNYYPSFSNLSRATLRDGRNGDMLALSRCAAAIFSSDWAAQSAINELGADPRTVHVIPFGANLDDIPTFNQVECLIDERPVDRCSLLFLGAEWDRKGGSIAVEAAARLNRQGLPTTLVVAGCQPRAQLPDFVQARGFLSKLIDGGRRAITQLLASAHFLILPTRADATPVVLSEACAFGVPCLATDTGGIGTVIRDGVNGFTFDYYDSGDAYADAVLRLFSDQKAYRELALSARSEYSNRLNWGVSGQRARDVIHDVLAQ